MVGICKKYKGKIIEFLGDGLFIAFGLNKDDSFSSLNREENFISPKGSSKQIKIYSINEIQGLYNLKYEVSIDGLRKLDKKIEIEFYRVINKITQEKSLKGSIVETSSSYLVIETNENVELFDTLEIFYKEKIWGKVVYKDRNVIKVRFDNHQIKVK